MDIRIKSIHFDLLPKLETFVDKKVAKLAKFHDNLLSADVTLTLITLDAPQNKEVHIALKIKNADLFASKTRDSFEDALLDCLDALEKQLLKIKEKSL
ncbi:MAG: ribosome-associated translation inhibitor RaiA [Tannerellaceae bacterium]|jgi:putative sigma-54 modulation protein|nr:ribosome-associated translation inhibitor RaiA [Tannerellaceae bacterium]